ncbi:hypothetical protein AJ88_34825 [Mesorhizobium amorphae CCBAU 01583]|nr:hypothetical protein AJ88_34825 [Mesorhizobium amorphae CCBAU 01583]
MAQAELGRQFRNICGRRAGRIALQEAADRICPLARLVPKRLINLIGKWVAHCRPMRKNTKSPVLT